MPYPLTNHRRCHRRICRTPLPAAPHRLRYRIWVFPQSSPRETPGGKSTSTTSRDLHVALGGLTGDLYFMSAYYAIRAPRVPGTETRGPIRFHKAMAWIHGPGMILTPILGAIAFDQKSKGEKVHGIA